MPVRWRLHWLSRASIRLTPELLKNADLALLGETGFRPAPLPDGGVVAVAINGHGMIMNGDGTLRAQLWLDDGPYVDRPVIGPTGVIYINGNRLVHAINPDGSIAWIHEAPGSQKVKKSV